jgi:signal peptidase I
MLISLSIVSLIYGVIWLFCGLLLITILSILLSSKYICLCNNFKRFNLILKLIIVFIFCIIIRVFFFEIYYIPSGSMENTLLKGDFVVVNKLSYGPILPQTIYEIPWLNIVAFYINNKNVSENNIEDIKYIRLKGFSSFKRCDVVVFALPSDQNSDFYIKRIVGLPGDTVKIIDENVYANDKLIPEPQEKKLIFKVWFNSKKRKEFLLYLDLKDITYSQDWYLRYKGYIEISLTRKQKISLEHLPFIDSVKSIRQESSIEINQESMNYSYGPIIIPTKGLTIKVNEENYKIYDYCINYLEKNQLTNINNKNYERKNIEINGYVFKERYYFVIGDNFYSSTDSRTWGFLPEKKIVGKAALVLFSLNPDVPWYSCFRFERMFKKIK